MSHKSMGSVRLSVVRCLEIIILNSTAIFLHQQQHVLTKALLTHRCCLVIHFIPALLIEQTLPRSESYK